MWLNIYIRIDVNNIFIFKMLKCSNHWDTAQNNSTNERKKDKRHPSQSKRQLPEGQTELCKNRPTTECVMHTQFRSWEHNESSVRKEVE